MTTDNEDARALFPHTRLCTERIANVVAIHGKTGACTCQAKARRKSFLFVLQRARRQAYVDAYAKIRYRAKLRADQASTPQERQAFEEVASWAEGLEFDGLEE